MKKWIPNLFYPYEYDLAAEYLERQAAKGWILNKVGLFGFIFRREAPQELAYCVDIPSKRQKRNGTNDYLEPYYQMCEDAGWHFVGANMLSYFFVSEDPHRVPVHT